MHMVQLLDTSILAGERQRPLRREEYDRLVEQGCFEDERVELLHGVLITMSPQGPRHATVIENLTMLLVPAVLGRARVRVQSPLAASDDSEPEPDLIVVAPGPRPHGHPHTALLVVEVAETSLAKDRQTDHQTRAGIYAACGVPEYWVVNLPEDCVEVHTGIETGVETGIRHGAYSRHRRAGRGDTIALQAFPDITLSVDAFLG
jgi:Uma2 family endonuclease